MWAFAIQTNKSQSEAEELFDRFFFEYWYEMDDHKRLEGILVSLEFQILV
jgi:hypothetical protein